MEEKSVYINSEKCIGCGLCKNDCVAFRIELKEGKADWNEQGCLYCGHCEAICPQGAITITGFNDEIYSYEQNTVLDPDILLQAIQTRRSIRAFKDQSIDEKVVDSIIEAGRLAPTGGNGQGTGYVVIQDSLAECEGIAVDLFRKGHKLSKGLIAFLSNMAIDDHFFFKGAPLVIVVTGRDKVSASLAAQNMAFMAEAYGLGVLYSGFFTTCINLSGKLKRRLKLEAKEKPVTTLVIGYSKYQYHKTVHRKDAKVRKV